MFLLVYCIQAFACINYILLTASLISTTDAGDTSDISTRKPTQVESHRTTSPVKESSLHSSEESETEFTKPDSPTVKETHTNTSPSQPSHTNTDNFDVDVKDTGKTPTTDMLDDETSIRVPTHTDSIQTTQLREPNEKLSSEIETQKPIPKTTHTQINSTTELPQRTIHISPAIAPTKVVPSSLLSSVFIKQSDAKLTADAGNVMSSSPNVDTSEQPTVVNVNGSKDEVDFEVDNKGNS